MLSGITLFITYNTILDIIPYIASLESPSPGLNQDVCSLVYFVLSHLYSLTDRFQATHPHAITAFSSQKPRNHGIPPRLLTLGIRDCGVWWLWRALCRAMMPVVVVCFGYHLLACSLCLFVYLFLYRGDKVEIPIRDLLLFIPYLYSHNPRMDVRVLGETGQYACVCMSRFQLDKHPAHPSTAGPLSPSPSLYPIVLDLYRYGRALYPTISIISHP